MSTVIWDTTGRAKINLKSSVGPNRSPSNEKCSRVGSRTFLSFSRCALVNGALRQLALGGVGSKILFFIF